MAITGQRAARIVRVAINNTLSNELEIKREDTLSDLGIGDSDALDLLDQNILLAARSSSVRISGNLNFNKSTTFSELFRQLADRGTLVAQ